MSQTTDAPSPFTPTGAMKPASYKITKWHAHSPARPPGPLSEAEREALGFYDASRAVSIDRVSGRFVYNPQVHESPTPRGTKVRGAPRPFVEIKCNSSPLFWRPKLMLVTHMGYLEKTARMRSPAEQKAVEEELELYLRLKAKEDERENSPLSIAELVDYVNVLKEREMARQAEEEADIVELKKILEVVSNEEETIDAAAGNVGNTQSPEIRKKKKHRSGDNAETRKVKRKHKRKKSKTAKSAKSFQGGLKNFFGLM